MINVNQITAQLAKMPDQALQQYAMMHKNDPYTVSLALSESNRRKQMRDSAQGQQGMTPQPKVVDQGIAGMAAPAPQPMPEDVGIGALPAPNMQGMAGGGIVAFGDGGEVQRFQTGGSLIDRMQAQGVAALRPLQDQVNQAEQMYVAAAKSGDPAAISLYGKALSDLKAQLAEKTTTQFGNAAPAVMAQLTPPAVAPAVVIPSVNPPVAPPAPTDKVRPAPGAGGPRPASAASNKPPVAPVAPAAQAGLGDLATTYSEILKKQDFKDPAEARLGALEAKERAAAEENKAALLRDQAKFDDAYKGREKRLSDRELDIGKQKDTNTGLAFLNAGLAIMSTPGGLATAIGQGAQVGTAQFAAGLDKIRSAQERLDDARDKMEDLKLNRAEMSAKQIRDAEKDIRNVGIDAEKRGIDGLRMAADVNRRTAADMFKATVDVGVNRERMASAQNIAEMQEKGQSSRSAAQIAATINTPDRMAFNAALQSTITKEKPSGDPVAAYQKLMEMKREPMTVEKMRAEWLDPMKRQQISTDYPNVKTFEDYMLVMGAGGGGAGGGFKLVGVK